MAKMYLGHQPVRIIERSKNQLIPFPYIYGTIKLNGVRFTVNDDGSIYIIREERLGKSSQFMLANLALKTNTPYTISGGKAVSGGYVIVNARKANSQGNDMAWLDSKGNSSTGILQNGEKSNYCSVYITNNVLDIGESVIIYPMLNEGEVAKPFEPYNQYFKIRTGAKVRNPANLIPFPYATQTKVISGVRFTVNNDGGITVTREEALGKSSLFVLTRAIELKTNTYYTISGGTQNISTGYITVLARKNTLTTNDLAWFESAGAPSTSKLNDGDTVNYLGVYVGSTSLAVGESATIYPMLVEGETTKPYFIID